MIFSVMVDPIVRLLNFSWLTELSFGSIIIRLIIAMLCGGMLGIERTRKHQSAGFRTYILVCLGSTIAMITNQFITETTGLGDGARLGAQVISGIGFLGAGTILVTSRNQIRGLTTAAGLWACACLGLAIGVGFYTLAIISVVLVITILSLLPFIENLLMSKSVYTEIHIEFGNRKEMKQFLEYARGLNINVVSIEHNPAYSASGLSVYTITLKLTKEYKKNHRALIEKFQALDYVNYVEEIK